MRRLAWGPVRDTVLQVRYVSAAGEVVKAGGPTVKNVSGFDLCRLLVGSRGTLGLLADVILRTRPRPVHEQWFTSERDPWELLTELYRPTSILWDGATTWVLLDGHPVDIEPQAGAARLDPAAGPPELPSHRWSVAPSSLPIVADDEAGSFVAEIGVGIVHHIRPAPPTPPDRETDRAASSDQVTSSIPTGVSIPASTSSRAVMLPGARHGRMSTRRSATTEAAARAAGRAAAIWGLGEPVLMRVGMNAIFAAGAMVLRVSLPSVGAGRLPRAGRVLARCTACACPLPLATTSSSATV